MKKKWNILFCDPFLKPCPVSEFLDSCRPEHQVKVLHVLELLEAMGPTLPRPYADLLEDGIHELRIRLSGDQMRLLYFFCFETYIVVYRALRKTTSRVPEEYIHETMRYRQVFLSRIDADAIRRYADVES
ncbi:MAG: type II toxin-antitoxin system RelE/ParE family toxin [Nitrospiraceae bacterium]|nr:type II toxin-antitoxin system RelE/ParE family toxin [Nitrospiraceae bacterium]